MISGTMAWWWFVGGLAREDAWGACSPEDDYKKKRVRKKRLGGQVDQISSYHI